MSRRPQPTAQISLIDFAGKKRVDALQQTSDVVAERRRQKRNVASSTLTVTSSTAGNTSTTEAFFASRVNRAVVKAAPRRVPGHAESGTGTRGSRQAHFDALRKRAREMATTITEEDEEDMGDVRAQLQRAFDGYGQDADSDIIGSLEEWMNRMRTCCICISSVKREDRIWSCIHCATPTHLACIQTWSTRLVTFAESQNMKDSQAWSCPNCRQDFRRSEYPSEYKCFCGKEIDPKPDPWILPHSCGNICDKPLRCGHQCKILCHPGKCPPCPLAVSVSCHCGLKTIKKRCGNPSFSCGTTCGRLLSCAVHKCKRECHDGECGPCETKVVSSCRCGKRKKLLMCSEVGVFQCDAICGKTKPCGHQCNEICHAGECPPCPTEKSCACGKTVIKGSCTELETLRVKCEHTCNKLLDCGKHRCVRRCHDGPCKGCTQITKRSCRCAGTTKEVPCSQEFLCDRKCGKDRNCGHHKCNRRCCDGRCPPCNATCNRKLDCGVCRCTLICGHSGFDSLGAELYNCPPCQKQNEVRCFCGDTSIMVPCGLPKKPPPCRSLCRIPPTCHHDKRPPHRCHTGPCPPCDQECDAPLECGHRCPSKCHDPVPTLDLSSASWAKRPRDQTLEDALVSLMPPQLALAQVVCPPCPGLVDRPCFGQHVRAQRKCHEQPWFSCGKPCGNWLPCGNHRCQKECHGILNERTEEDFLELLCGLCVEDGEEEEEIENVDAGGDEAGDSALASKTDVPPPPAPHSEVSLRKSKALVKQPDPFDCGECTLPCRRPRPHGCRHECPWPCHYEACPPCFEDVHVNCYCNQSLLTYACCEVMSWPVSLADSFKEKENPFLRCSMPCHKKLDGCPHMCAVKCHFGPCPPCTKKEVTARCKCGHVRQQLPCAQVWIDGKQIILDCVEDCKKAQPQIVELEAPVEDACHASQVEEPKPTEADISELRERRKDTKRKKREEEMEARRLEDERKQQVALRKKRCRNAVILLWVLVMVVGLIVFVKVLRDREHEKREEDLRIRRERDRRNSRGRKAKYSDDRR